MFKEGFFKKLLYFTLNLVKVVALICITKYVYLYMTLDELGRQQRTDKSTHKFLEVYDLEFNHLRDRPVNILEIGVLLGSSLRMWKDYFSNGVIHGLDKADKTQFIEERILIEQGDQGKIEDLNNVFKNKQFNIIIDDGGHTMIQQQRSLSCLLDRVTKDGYYVIEDLHTSYLHRQKTHNPTNCKTTLNLLYELSIFDPIHIENFLPYFTGYEISPQEILNIYKKISCIKLCFTNRKSATSIIRKK